MHGHPISQMVEMQKDRWVWERVSFIYGVGDGPCICLDMGDGWNASTRLVGVVREIFAGFP